MRLSPPPGGALRGAGILFRRGDLDDLAGQIIEGAVVDAQGGGGLGVDGDDAAVHDVVRGDNAGLEDVERHVGGVGAQLGVVDAAGCKRTCRDEAVRAGVERMPPLVSVSETAAAAAMTTLSVGVKTASTWPTILDAAVMISSLVLPVFST